MIQMAAQGSSGGARKKVFDDQHQQLWDALMARFRQRVEVIENKAIRFLDESFQHLRSAEGAFQLLQQSCRGIALVFKCYLKGDAARSARGK